MTGPGGGRAPGTLVLVVDDAPDLQDTVAMVLALCGCRPLRAMTGGAAIDCLRRAAGPGAERPCLVLLDLMLPDLRGEEVYDGLRAVGAGPAPLPVVLMSASLEGPARARRMGLPFLAKPFEIEDLMAVVQRHCGG